jgi:hypothetical protein
MKISLQFVIIDSINVTEDEFWDIFAFSLDFNKHGANTIARFSAFILLMLE